MSTIKSRIAKLEVMYGSTNKKVQVISLKGVITHIPNAYADLVDEKIDNLTGSYPDVEFSVIDIVEG